MEYWNILCNETIANAILTNDWFWLVNLIQKLFHTVQTVQMGSMRFIYQNILTRFCRPCLYLPLNHVIWLKNRGHVNKGQGNDRVISYSAVYVACMIRIFFFFFFFFFLRNMQVCKYTKLLHTRCVRIFSKVFVATYSLFICGLYSEVIDTTFLYGRKLKLSL